MLKMGTIFIQKKCCFTQKGLTVIFLPDPVAQYFLDLPNVASYVRLDVNFGFGLQTLRGLWVTVDILTTFQSDSQSDSGSRDIQVSKLQAFLLWPICPGSRYMYNIYIFPKHIISCKHFLAQFHLTLWSRYRQELNFTTQTRKYIFY